MARERVWCRAVGAAAALTVAVGLSACGGDGAGTDPGATQARASAPADVTPDDRPSDDGSAGQGDPTTDPADPSAEASDQGDSGASEVPSFPPVTREDLLDALWEIANLEGERPAVDLIREVGDDEWMTVHVECMTDMGFPTTTNNDEAVRWDVPAGQGEAFDLAKFTCEAQYPRLMVYQQPYSADQLTLMYDWMIEETIPCLAAEGYQVTDVVSLETFIAGYSPQTGFWTPDVGVPGGVPIAVQSTCPHMLPQEVLYGE